MTGPTAAAIPENERRARLSWRGPGGDRPDLPLPPARLPLMHRGTMRKAWRYVGFFGDDVMLCAATVLVGPFRTTFWSFWDRHEGVVLEHTRMRPGRAEVAIEGNYVEIRSPQLRASLVLGHCDPVEVVCPNGRAWVWTRKRAGVPIAGRIEAAGRSWQVDGLGVDDHSAGFMARHTNWSWSAGVGVAADGRNLSWNLVAGINDPPTGSERSVWVDGVPSEAGPVVFSDLDSVIFSDGDRLEFEFRDDAERIRSDNFGLIRIDYTHRFGTFSGRLQGIDLTRGAGVMEQHAAVW